MTRRFTTALLLTVAVVGEAFAYGPVTEQEILAYASQAYDKSKATTFVFGLLNDTPVIVEFVCSDVCPDYTVRIIHLSYMSGVACTAAGGVERSILVPVSIASMKKTFCFPKILNDHWDEYRR
jgi:hypothetical protein